MTETITYISLGALRESPFNPRKVYPQPDIDELADSLQTQGMLQPIVARTLPLGKGDPHFFYEIIFGHRRYRAAKQAGLDGAPVILRDSMTDAEAAVAQVHENAKRTDPNAIEEADSYAHLQKAHKMSVDAIVAATGKSKAYVYARLKLAKASPEVRKACSEDGLSPEIALELARMPQHNLQRATLKGLREKYQETPERPIVWSSVREASRRIGDMFKTDLTEAPFALDDAKLLPPAGACTKCPKRAGNDPDLQAVCADSICPDKACYAKKVEAHHKSEIDELRSMGHIVIEGAEAKALLPNYWSHPKGLTRLDGYAFDDGTESDDEDAHSWRAALKKSGLGHMVLTVIVNPVDGTPVQCITDKQRELIEKALGRDEPTHSGAARAQFEPDPRSPAERAIQSNWREVRAEIAKRRCARKRTSDDLRLIVCALLEAHDEVDEDVRDAFGWTEAMKELDDDYGADVKWVCLEKLPAMSADDLGRLAVMLALHRAPFDFDERDYTDARLALASEHGVDPATFDEQDDDAGDAGGSDAQGSLLDEEAAA